MWNVLSYLDNLGYGSEMFWKVGEDEQLYTFVVTFGFIGEQSGIAILSALLAAAGAVTLFEAGASGDGMCTKEVAAGGEEGGGVSKLLSTYATIEGH